MLEDDHFGWSPRHSSSIMTCMRVSAAVMVLVLLLAACSSGTPSPKAAKTTHHKKPPALAIYHNGYPLPACNFGIAPAPCQRKVSPVEVQFATPTDVSAHGQGGYDVQMVGTSIDVTAYVDQTVIGNCPASDGAACLNGLHTLEDDAGEWQIRY